MKQLNDLKSWDVKRIDAMFEQHGMGRKGIDIVSRSFSITESAAEAMATAIKDRNAPKPVTESGEVVGSSAPPTDALGAHNQYRASKLASEVNAAQARIEADGGSLAGLSTQQLQALAARFA